MIYCCRLHSPLLSLDPSSAAPTPPPPHRHKYPGETCDHAVQAGTNGTCPFMNPDPPCSR
eukprot:3154802-Prymnesium_polylepis.1